MNQVSKLRQLAAPALLGLVLTGCGSLPERTPPAAALSLPPTASGALQHLSEQLDSRLGPGQSAFWLLDRADLSFDARLALVDEAEAALDIQYFIWERDPSSRLFAHRVIAAADRGVRVRILLDDLTLFGQDAEFAALAKHPNVSVRSFNPWRSRNKIGRAGEFFFNIDRLNHRMHNKTMIVDGHFAMAGGRNIGDRYFGVWDEFVQNDLDILAAGPVVGDVAESFDLYWNSALSYAVTDVVKPEAAAAPLGETLERIESSYLAEEERLNIFFEKPYGWDDFFENLLDTASIGRGWLVQDLPDVEAARPTQLYPPLFEMIAQARERVLLSTAYLVPDEAFMQLLAELGERGVDIVLLTNSLASNNHMVAHLAYKQRRKELLRLGIELYEARDDSAHIDAYSVPPTEPAFLGLHTKAIVIDDHLSFVGSPNIDPRSLIINTEIGFIVDSESLASRVTELIERDIEPDAAWRVYFDDKGRLRWASNAGIEKNQPALGILQRFKAFLINCLPLLKTQA